MAETAVKRPIRSGANKGAVVGKKPAPGKKAGNKKGKGNRSGLPLLKYPGDVDYERVEGPQITPDDFDYTDTNFDYEQVTSRDVRADQVTAGKVTAGSVKADQLADRFMTAADYTMVDPSQIASEYGDINREQMRKNAALSSELALDALDTELRGLQNFAPAASALKRGELARDNQFNQQQRDEQLAAADPNLRADLMAQRERANAYASGRAPDSIQDRALELGIRSSAADAAAGGGFGVRSGAARKASELMSAQQRIGLSQYGDQLLTSNIGARGEMLLAPTQYSDAGAQMQVMPTQSGAALAMQIASEANSGNITADKALASLSQQEQFKSGLEQDTRKLNLTVGAQKDIDQARLNLEAGTFNVETDLRAQTTNVANELQAGIANQGANLQAATNSELNRMRASEINSGNAIQVQTSAKTLASQEKQFQAQTRFNAQNSNADRAFQAANINAGRGLETAMSNRAMKFDIQRNNKQMIFQDQQARKAEAAANARAAMSARASMANAQLAYKSNQEAIAANAQAQREQTAFQLEQQRLSREAFLEGREDARDSQNWATVGAGLGQLPSIVTGINGIVNGARDVYDFFDDDGPDVSADVMDDATRLLT